MSGGEWRNKNGMDLASVVWWWMAEVQGNKWSIKYRDRRSEAGEGLTA